jgi:hypothetical protein
MNELALRPLRADPRNYFVSLVAEGRRAGYVSDAQAERIGMETMALMAERTLRYTHGASASVRVETAQRLMSYAMYCIGHGLKALGSTEKAAEAVRGAHVRALYERGRELLSATAAEARLRLGSLQERMLNTCNLAYNDTLHRGISAFFAGYDADYGAHENPGSIDYPVCRVPSLNGVEYIAAYLIRLDMEERFCRAARFSDALLRGYHRDGMELLVNFFELSLGCAAGAVLCGKAPADALAADDREYLARRLGEASDNRLKGMLMLACGHACARLGVDAEVSKHAEAVMADMLPHIASALRCGHAETVFIVPKGAIFV